MEITKENIGQAISALRQCAEEHKKDVTPTFGIVVSSLCNDVADYLEKIKGLELIKMPSEKEFYKFAPSTDKLGGFSLENRRQVRGFQDCWDWIKSKIVK